MRLLNQNTSLHLIIFQLMWNNETDVALEKSRRFFQYCFNLCPVSHYHFRLSRPDLELTNRLDNAKVMKPKVMPIYEIKW